MNELYLVRHGQSVWNAEGRIQGQAESPLTVLGREQASHIGRYLNVILAQTELAIYTSPLQRALSTAQIIAEHLGYSSAEVHVDERLNDFDLGILSGYQGWDKVAIEHPELARLRLADPMRFHPPDGESGADVIVRITDFLDQLPSAGPATLIVCHGVINKFIRCVRRNISGADIIALGESQYSVFKLVGADETEIDLETIKESI
jgi:broad specificity phosphatase PhoE